MLARLAYFALFLVSFRFGLQAQSGDCSAHPDAAAAEELYNRGKKANEAGKADSLIVYMGQARALYEKAACWDKVVQMTRNLCVAYEKAGQPAKKQEALLYGLMVAQLHLPDSNAWKGKMFRYVGTNFLTQNRLDSAQTYLERALNALETAQDWKEYIAVCRDLARVAFFEEQFQNMENYLDKAFLYNHEYLQDDKEQFKSIFQLYGALYYRTGAYERALEKHLEGLEYLQTPQNEADSAWLVIYYNNIGLLYMEIGDIYKAQDYCENGLNLAKQLGNYNFQVTAYLNLAEFFLEKGQYEQSYSYYQKGLEVLPLATQFVSQSERDRSYINLNNGLAKVAPKLNQIDTAKAALLRNMKLHRSEPFRADQTYILLGETYLQENNLPDARKALEQALLINRRSYPNEKYPDIAHIYRLLGQVAAKENDLQQALLLLERGEAALNAEYVVEGGDRVKIISDKRFLLETLFDRAKIQRQQGNASAAERTISRAVELVEEMRTGFKAEGSKLFLMERVLPIYEFSIGLSLQLYEQNGDMQHLQRAFSLVEAGKAMLLLDALKTEEARRFGDMPKDILEEENRLNREIAKTEKKLAENKDPEQAGKLQNELLDYKRAKTKLEKTLENDPRFKKYYDLKYKPRIASLREIQSSLDEQSALIEFFIGNEFIYIFNVYKNDVKVQTLRRDAAFDGNVYALRQALTDLDFILNSRKEAYRRFCTQAHDLYKRCMAGSLEGRPGLKRLMIVPDGLLNYIPFEVLLPKLPSDLDSVQYKNLDYLIKSHTVHYHYSASLLLFERNAPRHRGGILGFAPHYPHPVRLSAADSLQSGIRDKIEDLPGAQDEIARLEQRFAGRYFRREQAGERRFKQAIKEPYSVVHLAMHGWINNERPQYSNLVFSYTGDSTEDDLLHAYELNLLKLETDLVVLSACETGFGKYERGEGVLSLGRGFMYAGAPSLLMTLWPINDQATAIIMQGFYEGLAQGLPKDQARRQAQLAYLQEMNDISAHPFFWAGFITLGDESPIELQRQIDWGNIALYTLIGALAVALGWYLKRIFA